MSGCTIFFSISTIVALYVAYLYSFKSYERNSRYEEWKKPAYPRIVYVFVFVLCLVPILNTLTAVFLLLYPVCEPDEIKIDSWLFRKPGEGEEKSKEN